MNKKSCIAGCYHSDDDLTFRCSNTCSGNKIRISQRIRHE